MPCCTRVIGASFRVPVNTDSDMPCCRRGIAASFILPVNAGSDMPCCRRVIVASFRVQVYALLEKRDGCIFQSSSYYCL